VQAVKSEAWYQETLAFVQKRHLGKVDKLGWPYYQHFERVADRLVHLFPQATPAQIQAALLHDALEPGECSIEELHAQGIVPEAIAIIERISLPQDGRTYLEYVADLVASGDVAAVQVKLADNLDAFEFYSTRTDSESKHILETRYEPSRKLLQGGLSASTR
jgi:(p)ppGpp synthase/HD superfamily hydrolase